jgi:FtsX extracellular domain
VRTAIAVLGGIVIGLAVVFGVASVQGRDGPESRDSLERRDGPESRAGGAVDVADVVSRTPPERGSDVLVFLAPDVTDAQRTAIEAELDDHPQVASYDYWDHEESVAEALRLFREHAEMLAKIDSDPQVILSSYRVVLTSGALVDAGRLANEAEAWPGVKEAVVP